MPESAGALTEAVFYILLSLLKPLHGYGIMQNVQELSGSRVVLGAGTLYGALGTLLKKGWITPFGDEQDRKKQYVITPGGRQAALFELARLEELAGNARRILGKPANNP